MKINNMEQRFDRSKFLIGTYYLSYYAQTEEHVQQLSDANIDFLVAEEYKEELLDLLFKHHIGIFPTGIVPLQRKMFFAYEHLPVKFYERAAEKYVDHPAIWGPFIGHKLNMINFPHYGELIDAANRLFVGQTPYLGLSSSNPEDIGVSETASIAVLGTYSYEEYIDEFVKNINLDYICFEHYTYVSSPAKAFENLEIVANKCRETGRDLWIALQVGNRDKEYYMNCVVTMQMLRFQAYTAMAFGAKSIIWSCWTKGWWDSNVLDEYGNTTKQYKKMCDINRELKVMAEPYMQYINKSTHFLGFSGTPYLTYTKKKAENNISLGDFRDISIDGGSAVLGFFEKEGGQALMIADSADPYDDGIVFANVTFETDKKVSVLKNGKMIKAELVDGKYIIPISQSCGVFVTIE